MKQLAEKIRRRLKRMQGSWRGHRANRLMAEYPIDPRIRYPSYKSFDDIIDVGWLESLDGAVTEAVREHLNGGRTERFDTGDCKMKLLSPRKPGSRIIPLTDWVSESYFDLNVPEKWRPSPIAAKFGPLMEFIATLPFKSTGRMIVMCDADGREVTAHRDHPFHEMLHEFIWFRTNLEKPFYVTDREGKRRKTVESYSAWFDTVNQYHGADATGKLSISIRVDGTFTDELRARIPKPESNAASTPALWDCLGS